MITFVEFLAEHHAKHYIGLDDDIPDDFDNWIEGLESEDVMELSEAYGSMLYCLSQDERTANTIRTLNEENAWLRREYKIKAYILERIVAALGGMHT